MHNSTQYSPVPEYPPPPLSSSVTGVYQMLYIIIILHQTATRYAEYRYNQKVQLSAIGGCTFNSRARGGRDSRFVRG